MRIDAHQQTQDGRRNQTGQQHQRQPQQSTLAQPPGGVRVVFHHGSPVSHRRKCNQLALAVVQFVVQPVDLAAHLEPRVQIDRDPGGRLERFLGPVHVVLGLVQPQHVPIGADRAAVRVLDVLEFLLKEKENVMSN